MARMLTPKDGYIVMNELVKQATGQQSVTVTDLSSFVSAGELVLATGMENVFFFFFIVLARTMVAARPFIAQMTFLE